MYVFPSSAFALAETLTVFVVGSYVALIALVASSFTPDAAIVVEPVISLSYWSTAFTLTELSTPVAVLEIVRDVFPSVVFVSFPAAVTTTGKDLITLPSLSNTLTKTFPSLIPVADTGVLLLLNWVFGNKRIESSLDTTE